METEPIASFNGEYRFLSNFWPCTVAYRDFYFPSVENAYVAAKTFYATETAEHFRAITKMSPSEAKRFGREKMFSCINGDALWEAAKISLMSMFVFDKFSEDSLKNLLLATGDKKIIEGNTWGDTFWGESPLGNGKNNLGRILMSTRAYYRIYG